ACGGRRSCTPWYSTRSETAYGRRRGRCRRECERHSPARRRACRPSLPPPRRRAPAGFAGRVSRRRRSLFGGTAERLPPARPAPAPRRPARFSRTPPARDLFERQPQHEVPPRVEREFLVPAEEAAVRRVPHVTHREDDPDPAPPQRAIEARFEVQDGISARGHVERIEP